MIFDLKLQVLEELKKQHDVDLDFPISQFLMVAGFLLILAIEQSVLHFQEVWNQEEEREPLLLNPNTGSYQNYQDRHNANQQHLHNDHAAVPGITSHAHHAHDGGYHAHIHHDITKHSSLRSVMLLLALSFHSVFEVRFFHVLTLFLIFISRVSPLVSKTLLGSSSRSSPR